ncbi:MAG: hypothetical protein HQ582_17085, partial [Planctomycetes bacterium]|nr:hypothetical protein [Planctomycetota bacterium]
MDRLLGLDEVLRAVSKILLWCTGIGVVVLLFWFGMVQGAGDYIYGVHSSMFDLSRHEFELIHYIGIAWLKTCVFLFFFTPWLATRLVLR